MSMQDHSKSSMMSSLIDAAASLASMIQTMNRLQLGGTRSANPKRWVEVRMSGTCGHVLVMWTHAIVDQHCWIHWRRRVDHDNEVERDPIPGDAVSSIGIQSLSCAEREADECSSAHSEWTSVTTILLNGARCLVPRLSLTQSPGLMVSIVTGSGLPTTRNLRGDALDQEQST